MFIHRQSSDPSAFLLQSASSKVLIMVGIIPQAQHFCVSLYVLGAVQNVLESRALNKRTFLILEFCRFPILSIVDLCGEVLEHFWNDCEHFARSARYVRHFGFMGF